MPYVHAHDPGTGFGDVDLNIDSFALFIPIDVTPATNVATIPLASRAFFAVWSNRQNNQPVRGEIPNAPGYTAHRITLRGGGAHVLVHEARLVQRVKDQTDGETTWLDVFELNPVRAAAAASIIGWGAAGFVAPDLGRPSVPQSLNFENHTVDYLWDVKNAVKGAAAAGAARSYSVGIPFVLKGPSLVNSICAKIAAATAIPALTITSNGVGRTIFNAAGGLVNCSGFIAVLAGAFAPTDARQLPYSDWLKLAAASNEDAARFFGGMALSEDLRRRGVVHPLTPDIAAKIPGNAAPIEVFYMQGLDNAGAPPLL